MALEEPLLPASTSDHHQQSPWRPPAGDEEHQEASPSKADDGLVVYVDTAGAPLDTFWACTFNLAKVTMGAGMMAVPKAFYLTGFPLGVVVLVAVAALTAFTLDGLVRASEQTGARSYSALTRQLLGKRAEAVLQLAVFFNCWIMNVVFLVVIGDVLVGKSEECDGLICELTGINSGLLADRRAVLALLTLMVFLPLGALHDMSRLAAVNIAGMAANLVFAAATLALAACALARGKAHALTLAPQWDLLGQDSGPLLTAMGLAGVLPILLNCSVCHQSLHPLMPLLRPYNHARMRRLVVNSLSGCNALYLVIALGCCLAFGPALHSDVLANITLLDMRPLLGPAAALAATLTVRLGYTVSLVGSYVLLVFPQRQVLGECVLPLGALHSRAGWLAASWGLCASYLVVACFVPSIWQLLSFVGASCATVQAFMIPGLITMRVSGASGGSLVVWLVAGAAVVFGALLFVNGVAQQVLQLLEQHTAAAPGDTGGSGGAAGLLLGVLGAAGPPVARGQ